jgi:PAS domain S-box-containing protein
MSGMKNSLYLTLLFSVLGATILMAFGIGYYWVEFEQHGFKDESHILRDSYISEQKNKIKNVVDQVVQYVKYQRAADEEANKEELKNRVNEALAVCRRIYDHYHTGKNQTELILLIKKSLPQPFGHRGESLIIFDMQGTGIFSPGHPDLEGENLVKNNNGRFPVEDFRQLIRSNGQGFLTWKGQEQDDTARATNYTAFVNAFKPLGWGVAISENHDEVEQQIKKRILAFINTVRFDTSNYVFAYDFDGTTLAHFIKKLIGVNRWNLRDPSGFLVTQEFIRISQQPDGGFLRYTGTIKPETGKPSKKIGYAASIPDWRWMIGAGVYADDIEEVLARERNTLQTKIERHIMKAAVVLAVGLTIIIFLTRIVLSRLRGSVNVFTSFFETAASEAVQMDEKMVHYAEFKHLVAPANRMIQERKRAQEALKESEERLNLAISATGQGLWDWNLENDTLVWDKRAFQIFGYDDSLVSPSREIIAIKAHPKDWDVARQAMEDHIAGRTMDYRAEYRLVGEDGTVTWVLDKGRITKRDDKGKALRAVGTYIDITPAKLAESEKNELVEQLNRSKKMEALGLLAGGVAHDLNNVLSGIVSYPDLLLENLPDNSSLKRPLMTIRDSGHKAAAIVQDLLTLARRGVVTYDVVNLNQIVTESLDAPEHERLLTQYPQTKVETHLDPSLLNIRGSVVHIRKSLLNLVSNAFEAQQEEGSVIISTCNRYFESAVIGYETILPGEYAVLSVEDFGTGIATEDIKRIFEPFYTRKIMGRHSGTGLGMAIVWGTLRDHHGFIDVKSTEGKGSVFELYFPITREQPVSEIMEVSLDALTGSGEHILVIDDVLEQRQISENLLRRLGYKVTVMESGEAAIEYLRDHSVDLLLLDMIMDPGIDGLDTYRRIIEMHPGQKALITSGFTETDRVRAAQLLGAGQYLRKPFTFRGLGLAVRLELKGKGHEASPAGGDDRTGLD